MKYLNTNAQQWDKRTGIHKDSEFYDLDSFIGGKSSLNKTEMDRVGKVDGLSMLHLQCHFGQDTLSWARLGAQVTGVDISPKAIALAKNLADQIGVSANFVCCDVCSTNDHINQLFDIVFTSYGTIVWLHDLKPWAKVIAERLQPGGFFYMIDFHPLLQLYDTSTLKIKYPYFNEGPIEEFGQYTYTDGAELNMTEITFSHAFSDILNALLGAGLILESFNEYDFSNYNCFENMQEVEQGKFVFDGIGPRMPHMFDMKFRK